MKSLLILSLFALLCLQATVARKGNSRMLTEASELAELQSEIAELDAELGSEASEIIDELEELLAESGDSDLVKELEEAEEEANEIVGSVVATMRAGKTHADDVAVSLVSQFRFNLTVAEFNAQNGSKALIASIATLLNITQDFISVLSVVDGSAVATTSVTTYSDNNQADIASNQAQMDAMSATLKSAANSDYSFMDGAGVIGYSGSTSTSGGSSKSGLSKAGIICLAVILPIAGLVGIALGVFFYMKAKAAKKGVMKIANSPSVGNPQSALGDKSAQSMTSARPLNQ